MAYNYTLIDQADLRLSGTGGVAGVAGETYKVKQTGALYYWDATGGVHRPAALAVAPTATAAAAAEVVRGDDPRLVVNPTRYDASKKQTSDALGNIVARGDAADAFQQYLRALARNAFVDACKARGSQTLYFTNSNPVVYTDPSASTNGTGTWASPYTSAQFFALQASGLASATRYGFKEKTKLTQTGTFAAGSSVIAIPGPNTIFFTYDAATGQPVIDKSRLATIDAANLRPRVIAKSSGVANIGGSAISGLRLTGAFDATNPRGVFISAGSTTSGFTLEHCVIDGLTMSATDSSRVGQAVEVYIDDFVCRFNKVTVKDCDGIYMGRSGGTGAKRQKVYGNHVVILKESTDDGVDCVQVYCPVDGVETGDISDNWLENRINAKQVIMLEDNSGIDAASFIVERNFCMGSKLDTGHTSQFNQKVINANIRNAVIRHNYVEAGEKGIFLALANAQAYGNLILMIGGDGDSVLRSGIESYQSATHIQHNTIISFATPSAVKKCGIYHHGGSASNIRNNVVVGEFTAGLHVTDTSDIETGNTVAVSGIPREHYSTGASVALGAGGSTVDPQISMAGWPLIRPSPVAVSVVSATRDVWGSIWSDSPGAIQQQPSFSKEDESPTPGNRVTNASRSLTAADNGRIVELTGAYSLTVDKTALPADFLCFVRPYVSTTASIVSGNGSLLNGSTTTVTRAEASNKLFAIMELTASPGSYVVTGA